MAVLSDPCSDVWRLARVWYFFVAGSGVLSLSVRAVACRFLYDAAVCCCTSASAKESPSGHLVYNRNGPMPSPKFYLGPAHTAHGAQWLQRLAFVVCDKGFEGLMWALGIHAESYVEHRL